MVWSFTGLWHGAAWNFVIWGVLFAVLLVAEKLFLGKILEKMPRVLSHTLIAVVIMVSFVIFNADSLAGAATDIGGMFGAAQVPLVNDITLYYLRNYGVILALGILGSTPLAARAAENLRTGTRSGAVMKIAEPIIFIAVLLLCTAFLVDGSFNPFLYFRF